MIKQKGHIVLREVHLLCFDTTPRDYWLPELTRQRVKGIERETHYFQARLHLQNCN